MLAATAAGISGLLAFCVAGAWVSTALVSVDRSTYDAVRVGQPEDEVRSVLPNEKAGDPSVSGGAACVDYQASLVEQVRVGGGLVYRFCYRGGRLVDKQAFTA